MKSKDGDNEATNDNYGSPRNTRQWKSFKDAHQKKSPQIGGYRDADERTPLLSPKKAEKSSDDAKGESVLADLRKELEMDSHRIPLDELYTRLGTNHEIVSVKLLFLVVS